MQKFTIEKTDAGQRLDKYLSRIMPLAPKSFFYKMMRKKNITLNDKKVQGNEHVEENDVVTLWLADDTIAGFRQKSGADMTEYIRAKTLLPDKFPVVYEDESVLILNKPAGILSQKAEQTDASMNEAMLGYLYETGKITSQSIERFKPGICNRLDRNTSGLLLCGLTLPASQCLNEIIAKRRVRKFYYAVVDGILTGTKHISGFLYKDEKTNQVTVTAACENPLAKPIETVYRTLQTANGVTLLEVELVTGRSHQIRAHLASIEHPIIGDYKYGNKKINEAYKKSYGISSQLLHAYKLVFPEVLPKLPKLEGKVIQTDLPSEMAVIMKDEGF
jgi:23S rRNA pseudouridine955/2504/2580 synthase